MNKNALILNSPSYSWFSVVWFPTPFTALRSVCLRAIRRSVFLFKDGYRIVAAQLIGHLTYIAKVLLSTNDLQLVFYIFLNLFFLLNLPKIFLKILSMILIWFSLHISFHYFPFSLFQPWCNSRRFYAQYYKVKRILRREMKSKKTEKRSRYVKEVEVVKDWLESLQTSICK